MYLILVIDDVEDHRENLSEILTLNGYRVMTAQNGKIGVEKALKEKPDLIPREDFQKLVFGNRDIDAQVVGTAKETLVRRGYRQTISQGVQYCTQNSDSPDHVPGGVGFKCYLVDKLFPFMDVFIEIQHDIGF